ncbi:MAG: hypothetical protein ACJ75K_18200 [Actinomycetes bacterium]
MSETIGQPGDPAPPRPLGIGEILSTALQLYRRHWRTLLTIAAVVVVPITLLHYLFGDLVRTQGETTRNGSWRPPPGRWGSRAWWPRSPAS